MILLIVFWFWADHLTLISQIQRTKEFIRLKIKSFVFCFLSMLSLKLTVIFLSLAPSSERKTAAQRLQTKDYFSDFYDIIFI